MDGGGHCLALWNPARDALPGRPVFSRQLTDPALTGRLYGACERLGHRLV